MYVLQQESVASEGWRHYHQKEASNMKITFEGQGEIDRGNGAHQARQEKQEDRS